MVFSLQKLGRDELHDYFSRPATKWQEGYGNVAFGRKAQIYYEDINKMISDKKNAICFKTAIIPGSELSLGDGLGTSRRFREMAAKVQGIQVPESERNLITICILSRIS